MKVTEMSKGIKYKLCSTSTMAYEVDLEQLEKLKEHDYYVVEEEEYSFVNGKPRVDKYLYIYLDSVNKLTAIIDILGHPIIICTDRDGHLVLEIYDDYRE